MRMYTSIGLKDLGHWLTILLEKNSLQDFAQPPYIGWNYRLGINNKCFESGVVVSQKM